MEKRHNKYLWADTGRHAQRDAVKVLDYSILHVQLRVCISPRVDLTMSLGRVAVIASGADLAASCRSILIFSSLLTGAKLSAAHRMYDLLAAC